MIPRFIARGRHRVSVVNPNGRVARTINVPNMLLNGLFESMQDMAASELATHINVGAGTSSPAPSNAVLQDPLGEPIPALLTSPSAYGPDHETHVGNEKYRATATWLPGSFPDGTIINELGVYNKDGALVSRTLLPTPLHLEEKQVLIVEYTLAFTYPLNYSGTLTIAGTDHPATLYLQRPILALCLPTQEFQASTGIVETTDPYNTNWRVGLGDDYDFSDFATVHNATASTLQRGTAGSSLTADPAAFELHGEVTGMGAASGSFRHMVLSADATDEQGNEIDYVYAVLDLGTNHDYNINDTRYAFSFQMTW